MHDSCGFIFGIAGAEIGQKAVSELFRFANVEHSAGSVEHSVYGRSIFSKRADPSLQVAGLGQWQCQCGH